ncbi:hypothetical protein J5J86_22660 [Aquabacter sp. L1I39]|uniref:hypothetical protein n=1 Tax=Aquabacter sp. L1I39 TaxID=2820278 RepID=UPI001AD9696C|nr:hypothetical protein [Aquabacter sp. L1I39]QTL03496.1 hypothetical protein J5J86_22660 [Aquabacter sp. L1I39]
MFPIFIHVIDDRSDTGGGGILIVAILGLAAVAAAVFGVVFLIFGFPVTVLWPLAYLVSGLLFPGVLSLSLIQEIVCLSVILAGFILLLSLLPRWVGAGLCGLGTFLSLEGMGVQPGLLGVVFLILVAIGFSAWGFVMATLLGRLPVLRTLRAISRSRAANVVFPPLVAVGLVLILEGLDMFGPPSAQTVSPLKRDAILSGIILVWLLLVGGVTRLAQRKISSAPPYGARRRA